jgi:hypothetical protein
LATSRQIALWRDSFFYLTLVVGEAVATPVSAWLFRASFRRIDKSHPSRELNLQNGCEICPPPKSSGLHSVHGWLIGRLSLVSKLRPNWWVFIWQVYCNVLIGRFDKCQSRPILALSIFLPRRFFLALKIGIDYFFTTIYFVALMVYAIAHSFLLSASLIYRYIFSGCPPISLSESYVEANHRLEASTLQDTRLFLPRSGASKWKPSV